MPSKYYCIILFLYFCNFCIQQTNIKQPQWDNTKNPQARVNNLNEDQINEFLSFGNKGTYSLSTSTMTVEFYNEKGGFAVSQIKLTNSTQLNSPHHFMLPWTIEYAQYPTLWQVELIGQEGLQTYYDSASPSLKKVLVNTKEQLTFQYNLTDVQYVVNCTILSINDALEFYIDIVRDKDSLHCLNYVYYPMIEGIGSIIPKNDTFFYPVNYGQVFNNPGHMNIHLPGSFYPSTYTSFQYMSYYHNNQSGIYLGAHDPHASTKNFYFWSDSYRGRDSFHLPHSAMGIFNYPSNMCVKEEKSTSLSLQYRVPYPIILKGFHGSWWDAAQIYREWVIPNADWTKKGPIRTRTDFPEWYINNTLWVNTNWLPGVLNCTLGDPDFVLEAVLQAYNALKIPFAVHWYCWEFYPFDTNYPDYLPAKSGFQDTINELHKYQIKILPYINGRLYDVNAPSYNQNLHSKRNVNNTGITYDSSVKASAPRMNNRTPIQVIEIYASGQFFAVMCPYTEYWQSVLSDKVDEIVLHYDTDGLYIDQIGAAPPYLCADPSHGHPTLGGSYWAEGYSKLLDQMTQKNGNERIFITEENAESYMSSVQGFLSLSPFSECNMVPAWMTIYGGYQMSVGRTFTDYDLLNEGEGFSFKMGQMFIYGAQMGWFALSGTDGFGNRLFTNPKYQPVSLTKYRLLAKDFLIFGRLLRPLEMYVGTNTSVMANFCLPMPITQSSVWESYDSSYSIPVIAALFTNTSPKYNDTLNTSIDLSLYPVLPDKAYRVTQYNDDGSSSLFGVFNYPTITISAPLSLLSTLYLTITVA